MLSLIKRIAILSFTVFFAFNYFSFCEDEMSESDYLKLKNKPMNGFFGLSFTNIVPQKAFQDNIKKSGQGFSLFGGYHFDPIPVAIGIEGDILFNGSKTRYFDVYRSEGNWYLGQDTVETQTMVIPINAFIRLQPEMANIVSPYIEGFFGFTMLSASASLKTYYFGNAEDKDELTSSFHYGVGAGVMIKIVDFLQAPDGHSSLYADIRARYINGSETDYYDVTEINPDSSVKFEKFRSKTDMVMFLFGITFRF